MEIIHTHYDDDDMSKICAVAKGNAAYTLYLWYIRTVLAVKCWANNNNIYSTKCHAPALWPVTQHAHSVVSRSVVSRLT